MGYVFQGLIAVAPAASEASAKLSTPTIGLGQGLLLLPGPVVDPDELVGDVDPLWHALVERVAHAALSASAFGPIAYVEAEFFGGVGDQSTVVWHRRQPVLGPLTQHFDHHTAVTAASPINAALRQLGARASVNSDEFDTLRLGRHRHVEDWATG